MQIKGNGIVLLGWFHPCNLCVCLLNKENFEPSDVVWNLLSSAMNEPLDKFSNIINEYLREKYSFL